MVTILAGGMPPPHWREHAAHASGDVGRQHGVEGNGRRATMVARIRLNRPRARPVPCIANTISAIPDQLGGLAMAVHGIAGDQHAFEINQFQPLAGSRAAPWPCLPCPNLTPTRQSPSPCFPRPLPFHAARGQSGDDLLLHGQRQQQHRRRDEQCGRRQGSPVGLLEAHHAEHGDGQGL